MENLSLNNSAHNQQDLQIAIRNEIDVFDFPMHQHVSDDILEEPKESPIKRRYTGVRDLRAISQNQIIGELSQNKIQLNLDIRDSTRKC